MALVHIQFFTSASMLVSRSLGRKKIASYSTYEILLSQALNTCLLIRLSDMGTGLILLKIKDRNFSIRISPKRFQKGLIVGYTTILTLEWHEKRQTSRASNHGFVLFLMSTARNQSRLIQTVSSVENWTSDRYSKKKPFFPPLRIRFSQFYETQTITCLYLLGRELKKNASGCLQEF